MSAQIAIVDYGMGNLQSVAKALEHVGTPGVITNDPAVIADAGAVLLPGVGAFGQAMEELENAGVRSVVRDRAIEAMSGGRPFLGICLGMQVLVDEGEEDPGVKGLGVIRGTSPRLRPEGLKVPHMGWNSLRFMQPDNPLFEGLSDGEYVYFVHSYFVMPADSTCVAAVCDYGGEFPVALRTGNLFATQFHPEKSQGAGLRILKNFAGLAPVARAAYS